MAKITVETPHREDFSEWDYGDLSDEADSMAKAQIAEAIDSAIEDLWNPYDKRNFVQKIRAEAAAVVVEVIEREAYAEVRLSRDGSPPTLRLHPFDCSDCAWVFDLGGVLMDDIEFEEEKEIRAFAAWLRGLADELDRQAQTKADA